MEDPVLTLIDLDARFEQVLVVGVLHLERRGRVAVGWEKEADVDACACRLQQSLLLLMSGHEVR